MLHSGLAYKYKSGGCNATCYGKTKHHFNVPICNFGISHLTGKKVKLDNNKLMGIQEHLLCCNYSPFFEDISILVRENNDFKLKILDSLLIARDKPVLKKADSSLLLELFCLHHGYHLMFYHVIWSLSIPLCVYICCLFSFQYHITSFSILSKTECMMSI